MNIFRARPRQETSEEEAKQDLYRHHYEQICNSYYKIDDFRGRLLALWPILGGAAGGIALLASDTLKTDYLFPVGIFGCLVSVGVGIYEWTQTLRCAQLKEVARRLEKAMNLKKCEGQFSSIHDAYSINFLKGEKGKPAEGRIIRTGVASAIVYLSVAAGWAYIAFLGWPPSPTSVGR